MIHCPNCECEECREYFENKRQRELREKMFKSWNWNLSPAEVAQELSNLEYTDPAWEDTDEVLEHMAEFFDERTADAVRDCYEVFC